MGSIKRFEVESCVSYLFLFLNLSIDLASHKTTSFSKEFGAHRIC
jgi:hypothetical protein